MLVIAASVILVLLLIFLLWLLLICPSDASAKQYDTFANRAYAHRGLHGEGVPENSLPAFDRAAEKGYGIELDIHASKDGKIIVFHDDDFLRLCSDKRLVAQTGYQQIKKLSLSGTAERIPTLSQALDTIAGRVPVIVEFKYCRDYKSMCDAAIGELDKYAGDFCVQSFDPRILRYIRLRRPQWMRGQLACRGETPNRLQNIVFSNLFLNIVSRPHFISYRARETNNINFRLSTGILKGLSAVWTVRSMEEFEDLCKKDADMIIFESFSAPEVLYDETGDSEGVK